MFAKKALHHSHSAFIFSISYVDCLSKAKDFQILKKQIYEILTCCEFSFNQRRGKNIKNFISKIKSSYSNRNRRAKEESKEIQRKRNNLHAKIFFFFCKLQLT